ncbi:hypothetical protein [Flavobacterium oreochromis]
MKKGVSVMSGNVSPIVGEKYTYHIEEWYPATPTSERQAEKVTWELFKKRSNGQFTTTHIKKKGNSSFTFGEASIGETYRLEGYLHQPEGGGLIIKPKGNRTPKIGKIDLHYVDDNKGNIFSFTEKLRAKAHCINMLNKEVIFTLWEDDAKGSGHKDSNKIIDTKKSRVNKYGEAVAEFTLTQALIKKALEGESDIKELEFYVTVEYYKKKKHASENLEIKNPHSTPRETTSSSSTHQIKKAKGSPAEQKPASKKEEKGLLSSLSDGFSEMWDWAESFGKAKRDKPHTVQISKEKSPVLVGIDQIVREKFKPVIGNGEEAVIYITSEIAAEIEIDKNGKVISYPDYGAYNGKEEFKKDNKIYSKKIKVGKEIKSAFPTFKAYIYRGNTVGEAVRKLKQDLKFNTHENAESTILEVARHSLGNNKNYGDKGPIPPNSIKNLYRLRYKKATNNSGKNSYRYRIVDENLSNFPNVKDYKKEYDSGSMILGKRGSISIDPWKSSGLVGCVGIRGKNGENHLSTKETYSNQDKENYKYIYHSLNNYLESIIPELTGIYGRRGFSTSEGIVKVSASSYDHEIKVYVLVDSLPDLCTCESLRSPVKEREDFYNSFGTKTINYIEQESKKSNKFKGLYMTAQRRAENGFAKVINGNNPMNIKGNGDLGQIAYDTHESGILVKGEKFANFSSEDTGFKGYLSLLKNNYNYAYQTFFDDSKTIDDFVTGLEDKGKLGPYATGDKKGKEGTDRYKNNIKDIFESVKNDYLKMYKCKLCKVKNDEEKKNLQDDINLLEKLN